MRLELTNGLRPDVVIETVGIEAHSAGTMAQKIGSAVLSATTVGHSFALNQAILGCRPGGIVSMPGVCAGPAV
ncbi:hypothetical protein [Kozakia baliensis]|uniref:hypothetical protein n=1 Tax=Kozakia baliensis TaxID=153496 RepID=UPI000A47B5A0